MPTNSCLDLSRHLPALPKLDKAQSIRSYIREQEAHAKLYASDGRDLVLSWDRPAPSNHEEHRPRSPEILASSYGFGTPVLKPRILNIAPQKTQRTPLDNQKDCHLSKKSSNNKPPRTKVSKRKRTNSVSVGQDRLESLSKGLRGTTEKQRTPACSDTEETARLKERRERKRAKRAIVKPMLLPIAETTPKGVCYKGNNKVSAGFHLMHGFAATNVGSGRLTVKPSLHIGVFNRGKASAKARITKYKSPNQKVPQGVGFSEMDFLSKTRERPSKDTPNSSSRSTSLSPIEVVASGGKRITPSPPLKMPKNPRGKTEPKGKSKESKKSLDEAPISGGPRPSTESQISVAESTVWDIELNDIPLLSQSMSTELSKGTVIVNTQKLWVDTRAGISNETDCQHPQVLPAGLASDRSTPSIGPSQSASQVGRTPLQLAERLRRKDCSKYFVPVDESPVSGSKISFTLPIPMVKPRVDSVYIPDQASDGTGRDRPTIYVPPISGDDDHVIARSNSLLGYLGEDVDVEVEDVHLWSVRSACEERPDQGDSYFDVDFDHIFHNDPRSSPRYESTRQYQSDLQGTSEYKTPCTQETQDYVHELFRDDYKIFDVYSTDDLPLSIDEEYRIEDSYGHISDLDRYHGVTFEGLTHWNNYGGSMIMIGGDTEHQSYDDIGDQSLVASSRGTRQTDSDTPEIERREEIDSDCGSQDLARRFSQGRVLLDEYLPTKDVRDAQGRHHRMSIVEADVVKNLKNHWLPYRL